MKLETKIQTVTAQEIARPGPADLPACLPVCLPPRGLMLLSQVQSRPRGTQGPLEQLNARTPTSLFTKSIVHKCSECWSAP